MTYYAKVLKEENTALRFQIFKHGDGVQTVIASMPADQAVVELATVPDGHFGSGSGSKPNRCQIGGPGRQYTQTAHSGTVPW